ncbi:hypothetical protein R1sor_002544 [Riccia sorocarpa]|uniref:PGG domain-containing protein n=1 Tax=Riccia sorocarpa TaxID=122646 RepID=A0ABD3H1R0_9MARC
MEIEDFENDRLLLGRWERAVECADGPDLMQCLVKEPRLVRIRTGKSFNVLHLAVRKDWYGLVSQIAQIFSPNTSDELESRLPVLQPKVLSDLLIEKENYVGDSDDIRCCRSGLDVFAMACINCHQEINTLLYGIYQSCIDSFDDHPYGQRNLYKKGLYSGYTTEEWQLHVRDPNDLSAENKNLQRAELVKTFETIFPDLTKWFKLKSAPSLNSVEELEKLDDVVQLWIVTSPFLPLSECLILQLCVDPDEVRSRLCPYNCEDENLERCGYYGVDNLPTIKHHIVQKLEDISFVRYLLTISDSRRTVLHYLSVKGAAGGLSFLLGWLGSVAKHMDSSSPESEFTGLRSCFDMLDSSGRTAFELCLALPWQVEDSEDGDSLEEGDPLQIFSFLQPFNLKINRGPPRWDWKIDIFAYLIDHKTVHEVNGFLIDRDCDNIRIPDYTAAVAVINSPHLNSKIRLTKMKTLLDFPDFIPHGIISRPGVREGNDLSHADEQYDEDLTPLQQAVSMGDIAMVRLLAKDNRAWDPARFKNQKMVTCKYDMQIDVRCKPGCKSALHFAAEQGSPEMIRALLDSGAFDPCSRDDKGDTALHSAAHSSGPFSFPVMLTDFVDIPDTNVHAGEFYLDRKGLLASMLPMARVKRQEARYQGCLNMLLQAGVDIWQVNNENQVAFLHEGASPEYSLWWYEKLDNETLQQTTKLTTAANALSVTAALVATASYIGPLQPPLGYGSDGNDPVDKVQADFLSVRVFIVCNTLAFYIALVAIMLSLTPSLPMPQESMLDELKRIRRSVTLGLISLIMAIVAILVAFASASIAVIPKSWNDKGLTGSTLALGGLMCLVVLVLCCIRAARLMFHKNQTIRSVYRRWVYI